MNENYKITYSPEALNDIESIYNYIAFRLKAEQTAANQISRIRESIRSLQLFPERNRAVDWEPWASMGMRILPVDNYVVYYMVNTFDSVVIVTRVFYGGRNVEHIIKDIDI